MEEFTSIQELKTRIMPALKTKVSELRRKDIYYVTTEDIFNYLVKNRWMNASNLSLSMIVDDILNTDSNLLKEYSLEKLVLPKKREDY